MKEKDEEELDPKADSIEIQPYPSILIGHDKEKKRFYCKYPGCGKKAERAQEVLSDITIDHPLKEIDCVRCHKMSRLEGSKWCKGCNAICNAPKLTPEELAKSKKKWGSEASQQKEIMAKIEAKENLLKEMAAAEETEGVLKEEPILKAADLDLGPDEEPKEEGFMDPYSDEEPKEPGRRGRPRQMSGEICPGCASEYTSLKKEYVNRRGQKAMTYRCNDCHKEWTKTEGQEDTQDELEKELEERVGRLKGFEGDETMTIPGKTRPCNICGKPTKGYKCDACKGKAKPAPLKTTQGAKPRPELSFPGRKPDGKGNKVDLLFSPQEMVKEYKMLDGSTLRLFLMDADIVVKVERVIPKGGE